MSINNNSVSEQEEWSLALDLLVARAALDEDLRLALLAEPRETCRTNGIDLPAAIQLIITDANHPALVREIPAALPSASFEKTASTPYIRESVVYNGTTEYTETNTTTVAEAELTEAEAQTTTTTTTAEAEAEVVVVLT
jgi:hypothetical protein